MIFIFLFIVKRLKNFNFTQYITKIFMGVFIKLTFISKNKVLRVKINLKSIIYKLKNKMRKKRTKRTKSES